MNLNALTNLFGSAAKKPCVRSRPFRHFRSRFEPLETRQ
jgi:hypothetical protein